jgi:hypothetical protein
VAEAPNIHAAHKGQHAHKAKSHEHKLPHTANAVTHITLSASVHACTYVIIIIIDSSNIAITELYYSIGSIQWIIYTQYYSNFFDINSKMD